MSSTTAGAAAADQNNSPRPILSIPRASLARPSSNNNNNNKPERQQIGNRRKIGINISMTMGMVGAIDVVASRLGDNRSGIATKAISEYLQRPEIKVLLQEYTQPQPQQSQEQQQQQQV